MGSLCGNKCSLTIEPKEIFLSRTEWSNYYLINREDKNGKINYNIDYKYLNNIKYPTNFDIIKKNDIYNSETSEDEKGKSFLILSYKNYKIIKNNEKKNIYFACSLRELKHYEVDFIMFFFICQDDNYNNSKLNEIIDRINKKKEQNDELKFIIGEYEDKIGFYLNCKNDYDSNNNNPILLTLNDIGEKSDNSKLKKTYENFIKSIKNIENQSLKDITIDEIEKMINQKKGISLFLFANLIFENFLKGINSDSDQILQKGYISSNNIKGNPVNVDNNYSLYLFYNIFSNYNELINSKKENIISLITEKIFPQDKIKDIEDKMVYLLLINYEYYLYFKTEKKFVKIINMQDSNNYNNWLIMIIKDDKNNDITYFCSDRSNINGKNKINNNNSDHNDNNFNNNINNNIINNNFSNNNYENNNNIIFQNGNNNNINEINFDNLKLNNKDNNSCSSCSLIIDEQNQLLSSSITKKLVKLYYNDIYYKSKIGKKEIELNEYRIKLINSDWLNEYKNFYKYSEVTKNLPSIDKYSDIWNNLPNINKEIIQDSKFPEDLKISQKISPIMCKNQNDSLLEYPTNFRVIQEELFTSLLKEDNDFDNYEIQNDNNSFNCLLGDNHIFIYNNNSPNLLIFNFDKDENNYKIKYAFTYSYNYILMNEIKEIMNLKYLENYLFNKDLNTDSNQDQSFKEGTFINFNQEKLGISRFAKPPLIGLANIGATCYMNATLQCLANIDKLTNYFLIYQNIFSRNTIKYDLTNEYTKLVKNLWDENNVKKYYEPYDFKNKIGKKNPLFSGIAANDSKDLILFILQEMHKELNNINMDNLNFNNGMNNPIDDQRNEKGEYKKFFDDYYSVNSSIIQKLFYGEQESFSVCHNCNVKLYNFNVFSFLIFPLEKVRQYKLNIQTDGFDKVNLKDCFEQYTSEEILSGENQMYCNYCHQNADYSTYNKIYKHPEILVIILNRGNGLEYNVEFEYPKKIKINDYINFDNNDNYNDKEDIKYELISIISHLGDNSMSGHFIAICKNPVDKKWYKFNDAIVSESSCELYSDDNLNNIPYVLFYKIISSNIQKGNQITLYFDFLNGKQLYLQLGENTIFSEAIDSLIEEYELPQKNYKCYKGFIEIDQSKSIKDNQINDGDHVKIN